MPIALILGYLLKVGKLLLDPKVWILSGIIAAGAYFKGSWDRGVRCAEQGAAAKARIEKDVVDRDKRVRSKAEAEAKVIQDELNQQIAESDKARLALQQEVNRLKAEKPKEGEDDKTTGFPDDCSWTPELWKRLHNNRGDG